MAASIPLPTLLARPRGSSSDLGQNYNLDQLRVWNGDFFRADETNSDRFSANQVDLYYSSATADPGDDFSANWTLFGVEGALNFTKPVGTGTSSGTFGVTDEIDLNSIDARWFAIKVNSTHGQPWMKIAEVQFIEAVGPAAPFAITEIQYAPDADPNPTVTLTWTSQPGTTYSAFSTLDLSDWSNELADSLGAAEDENPDDGNHIIVTFSLENGLEDATDLFLRIQEE